MAGKHKPRLLELLEKGNTGVSCELGTKHWRILLNGRQVTVYPFAPSREGFSGNTKAKLRAAGIALPGDKRA